MSGTPEDAEKAWHEYRRTTRASTERNTFLAGFSAGEASNQAALDLMSSLAINPAIPYELRAMMRASLGEPPLSPWESP